MFIKQNYAEHITERPGRLLNVLCMFKLRPVPRRIRYKPYQVCHEKYLQSFFLKVRIEMEH